MEIPSIQMLVKILNDKLYSASCIAEKARIILANICKILDGYMSNFKTENAIRQLYNRIFNKGQLNR